jgi:enoyl-CoA hydratase/carnithine racemase
MPTDVPPEAGFVVGVDGAVATVTLNRPAQLNPQSPHTWHWLARVGDELPDAVRIVVIRGAGRSFSAGLDRAMLTPDGVAGAPGLAAIAAGSAAEADATITGFQRGFSWLTRPDLVSIAVVQGHAIGGGFQLALACDLRLVVEDAQFVMAEPKLGLVPDLGGTKRLVELVGYGRAASICLTARPVLAPEAFAMGLAHAVVAPDQVEAELAALVGAILALPPAAVAETKGLLLAAADSTPDEQLRRERQAQYRRLIALTG